MSLRKPSRASFSLVLLALPVALDEVFFPDWRAALIGDACVSVLALGSSAAMGVKWWVLLLARLYRKILLQLILLSFYTVCSILFYLFLFPTHEIFSE